MFRKLLKRKTVTPTLVVKHHELSDALGDLAKSFGDAWTADHTGPAFSCSEADSVARLLALTGHTDAAVQWLIGHAQKDDWDDFHFIGDVVDPEGEGRVMTDAEIAEYVAGWTEENA
ncbi:hypothetical protein OG824_13510 [Streptomyces prunicolor]|uniref:hypothetical protein n=1 Tax=Streptomyces prunicolor TaxID=67348 RepID=UPI00224D8D8C|nr:hypothetical protein [Streptomyces prunicolor]MCX5236219.1 hypothetical protein [Streptomyces prunicolor]